MAIAIIPRRDKESALDKIAKVMGIVRAATGTGIDIASLVGQLKDKEQQADMAKKKYELDLKTSTRPAQHLDLLSIKDRGTPSEIGGYEDVEYEPGAEMIGGEMRTPIVRSGGATTPYADMKAEIEKNKLKGKFLAYKEYKNKDGTITYSRLPGFHPIDKINSDKDMHAIETAEEWNDLQKTISSAARQQGIIMGGKKFEQGIEKTITGYKEDVKKGIDDATKSYNERMDALKGANQQLMLGNAISDNIALNIIARAVGGEKGVMTDRDFARVSPGAAARDFANVRNYLTGEPYATLTDAQRKIVQDVFDAAKLQVRLSRSIEAGRQIEGFSMVYGGGLTNAQKEGYKRLYGDWELAKMVEDQQAKLASKEGNNLDEQKYQKELNVLRLGIKEFQKGLH